MADAPLRRDRIAHVAIDDGGVVRYNPDIERERTVAIYDLVQDDNSFRPVGDDGGPYHLRLAVEENRLLFDVRGADGSDRAQVRLPMSPFRKIVKDYFTVCDSYYEAIRTASRAQIEAIDMGRRGLHNEGSEQLQERLDGKIELDFETARRLFTLICVLHIRGTER